MKQCSLQKRVSKLIPESFMRSTLVTKYYKHIMIVNDDSRVIRMMILVAASPIIIILVTIEVPFMLLENIYSAGIT